MFTGLVQTVGRVANATETAGGRRLLIEVSAGPKAFTPPIPFSIGESIAVNGCCLTLVHVAPTPLAPGGAVLGFDVIPETLRKTAIGRLSAGGRVNLERSVTPTTLLGGHFVQGHVDAVGRVAALVTEGEWRVRVAIPRDDRALLAPQGSIALDGVSLTVAAIDDDASTFDVCLIPETLARTTLRDLSVGVEANVEFDCLAKMVARREEFRDSVGRR